MKEFIDQSIKEGIGHYETVLNGNCTSKIIPLDCTKLPSADYLPESVKGYFFAPLHQMFMDDQEINRRACLYAIQFEHPDTHTIENAYRNYKDSSPGRNTSAIKKRPNHSTNTLYVGKVKRGIGGRLVTHMGYGPIGTGALQLAHWAPAIGLKLSVNVYAFDAQFGDFINPIELSLTKQLKPLIGNSK